MSGAAAVKIKEIDLSTRVAGFAGVYGAIIVASKKGPTDAPTLVTSDSQLLSRYTADETIKVGDDLANYSALSFLEKSNTLWMQRVVNGALFSGAVSKSSSSIYDSVALQTGLADPSAYVFDSGNDVEAVKAFILEQAVTFTAITAGVDGNSIELIFNGTDDIDTVIGVWNTANPTNTVEHDGTGSTVLTVITITLTGGAEAINTIDEAILFHASSEGLFGDSIGYKIFNYATYEDVVKEPNAFLVEIYKSSNQAVPVESFICSRTEGHKDGYGRNIFIENVLEGSNFLRAISNVAIDESIQPKDQTTILWLGGGDDGLAIADNHMTLALQKFANPDELYVTLIMDGGYAVPAYQLAIASLCENRKDCVGIFSVPYSAEASNDYLNEVVDYRKTTLNLNTSYAALYTPHVKITDRFNDRKIFVSPDGYAAAAISETGSNYEMWFPAAGFKRGVINVEGLVRKYTEGELDTLYNSGINPIRFFPGRGIVIWGQRTLLNRPSALDRLNVRLLLIVIEPAIKYTLEDFLFDLNDEASRTLAKTIVDSYMDNIKARRGVTDFRVVCDDTNNTPNDVDNNRMILDLYLIPTRSIEEIPFRVIITSSSVGIDGAVGSV